MVEATLAVAGVAEAILPHSLLETQVAVEAKTPVAARVAEANLLPSLLATTEEARAVTLAARAEVIPLHNPRVTTEADRIPAAIAATIPPSVAMVVAKAPAAARAVQIQAVAEESPAVAAPNQAAPTAALFEVEAIPAAGPAVELPPAATRQVRVQVEAVTSATTA